MRSVVSGMKTGGYGHQTSRYAYHQYTTEKLGESVNDGNCGSHSTSAVNSAR